MASTWSSVVVASAFAGGYAAVLNLESE